MDYSRNQGTRKATPKPYQYQQKKKERNAPKKGGNKPIRHKKII